MSQGITVHSQLEGRRKMRCRSNEVLLFSKGLWADGGAVENSVDMTVGGMREVVGVTVGSWTKSGIFLALEDV